MSLDTLETLSKFTSPLLIPLPPSPPPKISIPSRKPAGWISAAPRFPSNRFASINKERILSGDVYKKKDEAGEVGEIGTEGEGRGSEEPEVEASTRGREAREGSVSTFDTSPRVTSNTLHHPVPSPTRTPNRRIPSIGTAHRSTSIQFKGTVPSQGRRNVSGAMQYALLTPSPPSAPPLPLSHLETTTSYSTSTIPHPIAPSTASPKSEQIHTPLPNTTFDTSPHIHLSTDTDTSSTHGSESDIYQVDQLVEMGDASFQSVSEANSEDEEEEDDWDGEVLAEREADEEWMGYVRNQLNALFPDFFQETRGLGLNDEEDGGGFADSFVPLGQAGDAVRLPVGGVRGEIGELRDEIQRLRDVVGELANGSKDKEAEKEVLAGTRMKGVIGLAGVEQSELKVLPNTDLIVNLVRALDIHLHYSSADKRLDDLLSRDNLLALTERVWEEVI